MRRRLVIVTEIIAPYRIPVFNELAARDEIDLHVIFLSETDPSLRQWEVYREEVRFSHEVLKSYRRRAGKFNLLLNRGMARALRDRRPQAILSGGYSYLASWQAQRWAHRHAVPFLLWSESNASDSRNRFWLVETAKKKFLRGCQGCVVPGSSAAAYMESFGIARSRIFVAPNAVDVERFASGAEAARNHPDTRKRLGLPARYLLYVGRFVEAKGVFDLLRAYATLPEGTRKSVGLVMVGDGEARAELARRSQQISPGQVCLPGFVQRDELAGFYGLAEALVFPTHSDTWGFVVNEAQACGLPAIVSEAAGCAADLVEGGKNGYVVRDRDPDALREAMIQLLEEPERRTQMGQLSRKRSLSYTPQAWAEGVVRALALIAGEVSG